MKKLLSRQVMKWVCKMICPNINKYGPVLLTDHHIDNLYAPTFGPLGPLQSGTLAGVSKQKISNSFRHDAPTTLAFSTFSMKKQS